MISFVYFDLGGVVIHDFSGNNKWEELKQDLGVTSDMDEEFENLWDRNEGEVCVGRDVETLLPILEEKLNLHIPVAYSLLDSFVNRFQANKSIWPVLNEIHQHSKIGLLTNMYPGMFLAIKNRDILPQISWDEIIDSSVEGVQKPDPRIFQIAEKRAGAKAKDILFVENGPSNIKTASDFGWQTFLYDSAHPKDSSQKLLEYMRHSI